MFYLEVTHTFRSHALDSSAKGFAVDVISTVAL